LKSIESREFLVYFLYIIRVSFVLGVVAYL